jgi:hypothetical protein
MQYRITRRIDPIMETYYFHLERRTNENNNWNEIGYQCRTFESALKLLQSYKEEQEVHFE